MAITCAMIDFSIARSNMIESQVRTGGITDHRVLAAMAAVPREAFVPVERQAIAYVDDDLLIKPANGVALARYLMEPLVLARLLQLAQIRAEDNVLHVGCTTGYATAVLARLARWVLAIDEDEALVSKAAQMLSELGVDNATVKQGEHAKGAPESAPYDVIFIDGQVPVVPQTLLEQLADGGRLVAVVGERAVASALLYTRHDGALSSRADFEAAVRALPGIALERPAFVF